MFTAANNLEFEKAFAVGGVQLKLRRTQREAAAETEAERRVGSRKAARRR